MRCGAVEFNFKGLNIKLKPQTIESVSKSTGVSKQELMNESLDNLLTKAKERGRLKKTKPFKKFLSDVYKKLGEKFGLLKKEPNIYTDAD